MPAPLVPRGSGQATTITQAQADQILSADLTSVEVDVNHHVTAAINQNEFDALGSFDYNTSALDRASLLHAVNAGSKDVEGLVPGLGSCRQRGQ